MSDERQTGLSPGQSESSRQLVHDLRNSLFALRTGVSLLPNVRSDEARFTGICQSMEDEVRKAAALLQRLGAELQSSGNE